MARRKWIAGSAWSRGNVKQMWVPAEILKVRTADTPEKETYDVSTSMEEELSCEVTICYLQHPLHHNRTSYAIQYHMKSL